MTLNDPRPDPSPHRFLQVAAQNREMLRSLPSAPPRLVVIGNFNAGKSTLINALLGKRLLPAALRPTTGAVIRIVWGEEDRTTVRFRDGRMKSAPGTALLDEYAVIGAAGNSELVEDIQLETDSSFLSDDRMVVDIPGMEDDPGRYTAIFREVMCADVVLSIHDVGIQMPWSEMTFLQDELIENGCASICVVWNKCNLLDAEQQETAVAGAVARLKGVKLQPLEPLRSWYRLDALPELRKRLAGDSPSASFQTFQEDIKEALSADSALLKQTRATRQAALLFAEVSIGTGSETPASATILSWRERVRETTEALAAIAAQLGRDAQVAKLAALATSLAENRGNLLLQIRQAADEASAMAQVMERSLAAARNDWALIQEDYGFVHSNFAEAHKRQAELPNLIGRFRQAVQSGLQRSFQIRIEALRQHLANSGGLPAGLSPQAVQQTCLVMLHSPVEAWRQDKNSANGAYQILLPMVARLSDAVHAEVIRILGMVTEISGAKPEEGAGEETPETRRAVGRVVSSVSLRLIDQDALLATFLARMPTLDPAALAALRGVTPDDFLPRIDNLLMTTLAAGETQIEAAVAAVLQSVEKKITASTAGALAGIQKRWDEMIAPAQNEYTRTTELLEPALATTQACIETLNEIYYNFQAALTTFLPLPKP